tara:strand:- start:267 stop:947 length:681 start_codon:yes stop_codon:yes gene_type:complete
MDIDEQDKQDIKNLDAVYKRLKRGVLKGINPNQKACKTLGELIFIMSISSYPKNHKKKVIDNFNLDKHCVFFNKDKGRHEAVCVCSKKSCVHLDIYNYKGKNFMLGSVCTNALDEIARIKGLFAITDMLEKRRIINIDRNDRERYKCCYGCRKYNVKQKPHRKDPRANYRCGNCIHKNMVQCYPCDRWVLHQSQDILKIDGKLVANPHFKFRMCNDCRINKRELDL